MLLLQRFLDYIKQENLFQPGDILLLAVSGGVDSVVMCELCRRAGFNFRIAHCNFRLRGEESERDEAFVQELSRFYNVPFYIERFDTAAYAARHKVSIQVAARELRYNWFAAVLQGIETGGIPQKILTAHHADDNIETMVMNFFKGTGIAGLRGIIPKHGDLVRPLLFATKAELLDFARENSLAYVEDSSNASDKYTRNYFRNTFLPQLESIMPSVEQNMMENLRRFREVEELYQQSVSLHKKNLIEVKNGEVHIPALKWKKSHPLESITYEIIKEYGFSAHQAKEVIRLLDSETGRYIRSSTHRILKNRNWMIISENRAETSGIVLIEDNEKLTRFEGGAIECKKVTAENIKIPDTVDTVLLDLGEIVFPLLLRKPKPGDYFYPLGMEKKKKLNRFLSDLKLSMPQKENTWVLEMNKKIIWVVNRRIDNRFKIKSGTRHILQLRFIPTGSE
jgi:tRNA(Ile)-lysidine synthase